VLRVLLSRFVLAAYLPIALKTVERLCSVESDSTHLSHLSRRFLFPSNLNTASAFNCTALFIPISAPLSCICALTVVVHLRLRCDRAPARRRGRASARRPWSWTCALAGSGGRCRALATATGFWRVQAISDGLRLSLADFEGHWRPLANSGGH